MRVLITGANGDIAKSICKVIKKNFNNIIIDGTDIKVKKNSSGLFNKIFNVPSPKKKSYINKIKKLSKNYNLIIPATEDEIIFFSKNNNLLKKKLLLNSKRIINIFSSKLNTFKYLKKKKFNVPEFCVKLNTIKKFEKPFFVKKDFGHGNKNYKVILSSKDFLSIKKLKKNWIAQEYLNKNYKEYTCGIIKLKNFCDVIILERKLKRGFTYYAKRIENKKIKKSLIFLAKTIKLRGCINVQLKYKKNRYAIFEINPRISSTVLMRDMLNFKDCIWWINYFLFRKLPRRGYKILNKSITKVDGKEKFVK